MPGRLQWRDGPAVDPDRLVELFRATGPDPDPDPERLRAELVGASQVVSAWDGEALVGFARVAGDGASNACVSAVLVRPDWQRRGVGRELMRRVLKGRDDVRFVLRTTPAGEALYASPGFVRDDALRTRPRR